jgi:hypothetical protein
VIGHSSAYAGGHEAPLPKEKEDAQNDFDFGFDRILRDTIGWHVVVLEDPFATVAPLVRNAVQFYARPSVRKALDLEDGKKTPGVKMKNPTFAIAPMPKGTTFPKETVHAVFTVYMPTFEPPPPPTSGKKPPQPKPPAPKMRSVGFHIMAAADGPRTLLAFGFDEPALATRLLAAHSASPKGGTLADRSGLEFLRDPHVGFGGFSTLARLAKENRRFGRGMDEETKKMAETLDAHPVRYVMRVEQAQNPSAGRVTGSVELDRDLVMALIKMIEKLD